MNGNIILDSGADVSITNRGELLFDYTPASPDIAAGIIGVDGSKIKIYGYGYISLHIYNNENLDFEIPLLTYHCDKVGGTYLSDYALMSAGIDYRSIGGVPHLFYGDDGFVELERISKNIIIPKKYIREPGVQRIGGLHSALGHADKRRVTKSVENGFVSTCEEFGSDDDVSHSCIDCKMGKAKRKNHVKGSREKYLVKKPFYRVCSDLMFVNEYSTAMYKNNRSIIRDTYYIMTLICEYTGFCLAFVLQKKNNALSCIKRANSWYKTMFDCHLVHFHTDKGTEYLNKQCQDYFIEEGITQTTTAGYASMENGKAERKNRTIRDDIRTNLISSGLDEKYWVHALDYSIALRNKIMNNDTSPEKMILDSVFTANMRTEIMGHMFRPFGSHGIYYDVANKRSDNKSNGYHCFYLGPAYKPCTDYPTVLDGDLIVVMKRLSDGTLSEEIIQTTNVTYLLPTRVYKDCDLVALNIEPRTPREDNIGVAETHDINISVPISSNTSTAPKESMKFINYAPAKDKAAIEKLKDTPHTHAITSDSNHDTEDVDKLPARDETANQDRSDVKQVVEPTEPDIETNTDDSDHLTVTETETEVSVPSNGTPSASDDALLEQMEQDDPTTPQVTHTQFEHTLEEGGLHELLDASNATMLKANDESTPGPQTETPNTAETFPEDRRRTRSMFRLNQVSAVRTLNVQRLPGEKPAPQRLIYEIVRLDKEEGKEWDVAYNNEYESHMLNGSWSAVPIRTKDREILKKTVQMQVLCTEKRVKDGKKPKKVRYVLRGDKQHPSTYADTFSPTLSYDTLRMLLADAVESNRFIILIDIKTAYLNAPIDTEIYVELPRSMEKKPSDLKPGERVVHRLQRAVYGLKQSGRQWYETLRSWLLKIGFEERGDVPCVLIKTDSKTGEVLLIIAFFVDDMIITGKDQKTAEEFVELIRTEYKLKQTEVDNSGFRDILGIKLREKRDKKTGVLQHIDLSLSSYIKTMIEDMGLTKEFKKTRQLKTPLEPGFQFDPSTATPHQLTGAELAHQITWCREVVGALQYIAAALRPDLAYAANYMSRFVLTPHPVIIEQLMRILRYTYHTRGYMIRYSKMKSDKGAVNERLITYSDADHAGDISTRKSTLAAIFMMNNGPIAWYARVARFAATSSTDAEVAAMVEAGNNLAYYREVMTFFRIIGPEYSKKNQMMQREITQTGGDKRPIPLITYVDNTSAIILAKKGTTGSRTKHVGVRVARAHDIIEHEMIEYVHLGTKDMYADILTKAVATEVMTSLLPKIMEIGDLVVHK